MSYTFCEALTRKHARSFHLASRALPRRKQLDAFAVYAFCRIADDAVDLAPDEAAQRDALLQLRQWLAGVYGGTPPAEPWVPALCETIERCHLPRSWFEDLLTGLTLDQGRVRIADWPALRHYCYHVASVVGLLMTRVFVGERPDLEPYAIELGIALQLTNIVRDVKEDASLDRIYLPADEMTAFGVSEADIFESRLTPALHALLRHQMKRAEQFYTSCEPGIRGLPNDGSQLAVQLMRTLYAAILDEVEKRELNVFAGRAVVRPLRKATLVYQAWRTCQ
jgi:phytoene synthase